MLKLAMTAGVAALALAALLPATAGATPGKGHVQRVDLTFLPGDRVLESNVAVAAGVPVRMTVVNFTQQFHTFTVPGLRVNRLVLPAREGTPTRTTFTFTPRKQGWYPWYCEICPSGIHGGRQHGMGGIVFAIVDPTALP